MSGTPCILTSNDKTVQLTKVGKYRDDVGGQITEANLQNAIDACPELVPFRSFFPSSLKVISLGKELPLTFSGGRSGYIDNLLLTDDGHLIIVEMKLWRNREAIREVIAQVLEYGARLSNMTLRELEASLRKAHPSTRKLNDSKSLVDYALECFGETADERAFSKALERFLNIGEILYLVAGDGIHASVESIATWINARSGSPFHFGLLELDSYIVQSGDRLIVPRLLVKTAEIARHVVEVIVSGENAAMARVELSEQVRQETGAMRSDRRPMRVDSAAMTIESLMTQIRERNQANNAAASFGVGLLVALQERGFDSRPSKTEIAFGIRDEANPSLFYPLLSLSADKVYLQYPNKLMGKQAMQAYRERANKLSSFFDIDSIDDTRKFSKIRPFSDLKNLGETLPEFVTEEREKILAAMTGVDDSLVHQVDTVLEKVPYQVRGYRSGKVKVFRTDTGEEATPTLSILKAINSTQQLGIALEGSTGNPINTQLLGRRVIEALQAAA